MREHVRESAGESVHNMSLTLAHTPLAHRGSEHDRAQLNTYPHLQAELQVQGAPVSAKHDFPEPTHTHTRTHTRSSVSWQS